MRAVPLALVASLAITLAAPQLSARPAPSRVSPALEAQALDLAKRLLAIRSVAGPGNQSGQALHLVKDALVQGGWKDSDVEIVPAGDTAYLIATWPGAKLGPHGKTLSVPLPQGAALDASRSVLERLRSAKIEGS